jgi:hypothetical protein
MDKDRQELRQYLLGMLPEDEAVELDERLFSGEEMLHRLQEEQETLSEDFVSGRLSPEEAAQFREQCSRSPRLRGNVEELKTLLAGLRQRTEAIRAPAALTPARPRLRERWLWVLSPALAAALCVVAVLYVQERHAVERLQTTTQEAAVQAPIEGEPVSGGQPYAAFLAASVTRGAGSTPQIAIPPAASTVDLQVEVRDAVSSNGDWTVTLLQGGEPIWKSARVRLQKLGAETFLELHLAAGVLRPGAYSVQWARAGEPGSAGASAMTSGATTAGVTTSGRAESGPAESRQFVVAQAK